LATAFDFYKEFSERIADLRNVKLASEMYYLDNKEYPKDKPSLQTGFDLKNDYKLNINLMGTMYNKDSIMESSVSELFNVKPREEVIKGSPVYTFPTVLTSVGTTSRNGLVLSKAELDNMLAKELVADRINNNAFWCEMDHPEEEPVKRFRQVMNTNTSHRINKFFYTPGGEHLAGEVSTAPEGPGRILAAMIAMKSNVAFSMRAYAVMAMINGIQQKDINLVSYDSVYMPSNKASWGQTGTGADISEAFMQTSEFKDLTRSDRIMKFGVTEGQIMKFMESSWNKFHYLPMQLGKVIGGDLILHKPKQITLVLMQ
jgi:hypothetical protein